MITQTVLITGGSSGIGFELAKLFAVDGYRVVLVARGTAELERAAEALTGLSSSTRIPTRRDIETVSFRNSTERRRIKDPVHATQGHGSLIRLSATGGHRSRMTGKQTIITIPADLTDPAAPKRLVDELTIRKIQIDVLVNNAGYGLLGAFATADETKTLGMVQLNVTALTELSRLLLPGMLKRKSGRILNVASTAAFQPGPFMAVYYATKAYVLSFSEALHEELRGTGVTVTCLCPGPTATNFQTRAFIQGVPLFRVGVMNAATVAKIGYTALNRGQRLVIPGLRNAVSAWLTRLAPRTWLLRLVRSLHT